MDESEELRRESEEGEEEEDKRHFDELEEERFQIPPELEFIRDIPMRVSVELGRSTMLVKDLIRLSPNMILELDKLVGEPLEIHINNMLVARGEVVVINEKFGIRLTDIISPLETSIQP